MRAVLSVCVLALSGAASPGPLPTVPLAPAKVEHCERSGLLRPVCPRLVPRVGASFLSNLSIGLIDVFNLERGGEYPQNPERNGPPRMAHVVAVAGNVERLASFREPRGEAHAVRDGLVRRPRREPLSLGRVPWAGRAGLLYLMPSFPRGGMLGNHLVFSWREGGQRYALSLHAWEPLTASVATLRAMVEGLPDPAEAARLRRLSPVRRLALPRGPATARTTIDAPARRAFDVFVVAPARADVAVRIGPVRVLDSTRACRARLPFRLCFLQYPASLPGGTWTILVTKRSAAAARVRVDVSFR